MPHAVHIWLHSLANHNGGVRRHLEDRRKTKIIELRAGKSKPYSLELFLQGHRLP